MFIPRNLKDKLAEEEKKSSRFLRDEKIEYFTIRRPNFSKESLFFQLFFKS
jgi:hypothetical protein